MTTERIKIFFLVLAAAAVCVALHLLIGMARRRWVRRFAAPEDADAPTSLRRLLVDWLANAVRTAIWLAYFAFLVDLLPHTFTEFEGIGKRLEHVRDHLLRWLLSFGINSVVIVIVTIFLMRFASALIKTFFALFERGTLQREETAAKRRLQTLSAIFRGVAQSILLFIGLMIFLQQLRVNVTPILASAGVVGIAIGFGAQSLIKDLFAGLLILLEDQFNVGDSVKIGEVSGTVEQLSLRSTRVRGIEGALTTIPNGAIVTVSNFSKEWSRAVLDVDIDYAEDVDRAMRIVLETARGLRAERPQEILEDPSMQGVDKFNSGAITLRLLAKTAAGKQYEVARELRRRIILAFDQEGIQTPTGQRQLVLSPQTTARLRVLSEDDTLGTSDQQTARPADDSTGGPQPRS